VQPALHAAGVAACDAVAAVCEDEAVEQFLRARLERCLDILERLGTIRAGRLAEESGLTTGAVTAMIDRLEAMGYVRRIRDEEDRRRVLVDLTPRARKEARKFYEPLASQWAEISRGLTVEQIELLLDVARRGRQMSLDLAESLRKRLAAREVAASRRERRRSAE
jgi:DNA-binding MarR family transcriptional regulator